MESENLKLNLCFPDRRIITAQVLDAVQIAIFVVSMYNDFHGKNNFDSWKRYAGRF